MSMSLAPAIRTSGEISTSQHNALSTSAQLSASDVKVQAAVTPVVQATESLSQTVIEKNAAIDALQRQVTELTKTLADKKEKYAKFAHVVSGELETAKSELAQAQTTIASYATAQLISNGAPGQIVTQFIEVAPALFHAADIQSSLYIEHQLTPAIKDLASLRADIDSTTTLAKTDISSARSQFLSHKVLFDKIINRLLNVDKTNQSKKAGHGKNVFGMLCQLNNLIKDGIRHPNVEARQRAITTQASMLEKLAQIKVLVEKARVALDSSVRIVFADDVKVKAQTGFVYNTSIYTIPEALTTVYTVDTTVLPESYNKFEKVESYTPSIEVVAAPSAPVNSLDMSMMVGNVNAAAEKAAAEQAQKTSTPSSESKKNKSKTHKA